MTPPIHPIGDGPNGRPVFPLWAHTKLHPSGKPWILFESEVPLDYSYTHWAPAEYVIVDAIGAVKDATRFSTYEAALGWAQNLTEWNPRSRLSIELLPAPASAATWPADSQSQGGDVNAPGTDIRRGSQQDSPPSIGQVTPQVSSDPTPAGVPVASVALGETPRTAHPTEQDYRQKLARTLFRAAHRWHREAANLSDTEESFENAWAADGKQRSLFNCMAAWTIRGIVEWDKQQVVEGIYSTQIGNERYAKLLKAETELAEAKTTQVQQMELIEQQAKTLGLLKDTEAALRAELLAAREDTRRLDTIQANPSDLTWNDDGRWHFRWSAGKGYNYEYSAATIRAAADAISSSDTSPHPHAGEKAGGA